MRRRRLLLAAGGLACLAVLVLHARTFLPFMADDAFISLRYADRLLEGKGLTWTDGERVEGYSNLLWVLLVALPTALFRVDLVASARVLGVSGMLLACAALLAFGRSDRTPAVLARVVSALALALSAPLAVWAIGGLEQGLLAALLAVGLVGAERYALVAGGSVLPGAALGLLCLTRPDGPLLAGAVAAGVWLASGAGRAALLRAARLSVLPVLLTVAQIAFRRAYYGDWIPNSAHAKLGLSAERLREGLLYVGAGAWANPLLALGLLAGVGLLWTRERRRALLLLPALVAWCAYVAAVGGDIFPAYRHLVPALVLAAFLACAALELLGERTRSAAPVAVAGVLLAALAYFPARHDPEVERAREERWEWDGAVVGALYQRLFGDRQPLLAADPAGCLPYFSRLPSLDMLGLNDRFLATHPPPDFGEGMLGHELGNGAYVLSRRPDLVVFCLPLGSPRPCFRSGRELMQEPAFRQGYRLTRIETPPPLVKEAWLWVRVDGKLGIERTPGRIRVPGLVLAHPLPLRHRVGPDGTLRTLLTDRAGARIERVEAGTWTLSAAGRGDPLLRARAEDGAVREGLGPLTLVLPSTGALVLEALALPGQVVEVTELRLDRS